MNVLYYQRVEAALEVVNDSVSDAGMVLMFALLMMYLTQPSAKTSLRASFFHCPIVVRSNLEQLTI